MEETGLKELLIQKVENYFNDIEWPYEFDEQYSRFKVLVNLNCKLKITEMFVLCHTNGLMFHFGVRIGTDEENELQVMEFITRANNAAALGCFQMDMDNHDLLYAIFIPCEENTSYSMIESVITHGLYMLNTYGDELLAVMFGMKSAKDAIETVESRANK